MNLYEHLECINLLCHAGCYGCYHITHCSNRSIGICNWYLFYRWNGIILHCGRKYYYHNDIYSSYLEFYKTGILI